ncbi:MAG: 50S ribosomal protein L10 [Phycisphaerales bacterium]|nr:50S ribosomal protein L10 [Phycisphaerales bacterium]
MSKPVKELIMKQYAARIGEHKDAVLVSIRGVKAVDNNKIRLGLSKKNIKISMVRNALARKAFEGGALNALNEIMVGSSALVYGGGSAVEVARELVALVAKYPALEFKGALLDGMLFKGKAGVIELSKFPTKDEAIADVVTLILSPAKKLAAQIKGPGAGVAGLVKAIETKLEKGEAIAKVA